MVWPGGSVGLSIWEHHLLLKALDFLVVLALIIDQMTQTIDIAETTCYPLGMGEKEETSPCLLSHHKFSQILPRCCGVGRELSH